MIRAYLDSCMVIDLVEGEDFQQRALIKRMGGKLIFTSELVRLEARIKALRENHEGYLKTYDGFSIRPTSFLSAAQYSSGRHS